MNEKVQVRAETLHDLEYRFSLLGSLVKIAQDLEVLEGDESRYENLPTMIRNGEDRRTLLNCIDTLSQDSAEVVQDLLTGQRI